MKIQVHASGKSAHGREQQAWRGDERAVLQTATFAGQEMIAITDDAGAFCLMYLGFETGGFQTMDIAKAAAPRFAHSVLARMIELVIA